MVGKPVRGRGFDMQDHSRLDCPVEELGGGFYHCPRCGWKNRRPASKRPKRNCPAAPSRGLGDSVAKITRRLGIKPCGGCKKRQKWANQKAPYPQWLQRLADSMGL